MRLGILLFFVCLSVNLSAQHQHLSGNGYADSVNKGLIAKDTMKGSPKRITMTTIGNTHIHIEYGSPGIKGRTIWGGLVAYDQVWATGAHNATTIDFSTDVMIAGKKIKKGTYSFFTIPGKTEWTLILNTRHNQHLADEYNPAEDVVRVKVRPMKKKVPVQRLTYTVQREGNNAVIGVEWEYLSVSLPVQLK